MKSEARTKERKEEREQHAKAGISRGVLGLFESSLIYFYLSLSIHPIHELIESKMAY